MDDRRFDDLARALTGASTRRTALGLALGGLLAALGLDAEGKNRKGGKGKGRGKGKGGGNGKGRGKGNGRGKGKGKGNGNNSPPPPPPPPCVPNCFGRHCGPNNCGGSCGECPGGTTCQNGQCGVPCTTPCRPDQVCDNGACRCPSGKRECSGQGVVLGVCVECCGDSDCFGCRGANDCSGNPNGNQCLNPVFAAQAICGCRQSSDPNAIPRRPCGPEGTCSTCCSDEECLLRNGEGSICPAGAFFIGRNCGCNTDAGYSECGGGTCARLDSDPLNCGRCGNRCGSGATCRSGRCCSGPGAICGDSSQCCSNTCDFATSRCT